MSVACFGRPDQANETKTETKRTNAGQPVCGLPAFALAMAEDRGFEPLRAVTPNTLSNSPPGHPGEPFRGLGCGGAGRSHPSGQSRT